MEQLQNDSGKLYHRVPSEMKGHALHPLNAMKDAEPEVYEKEVAKYARRPH